MKPRIIRGRVVILKDENQNLYNNIDTDQIYHNNHLAITDISKMGQFALGNLKGYEDYPKKAQKNDILIAGRNFGAGSSRQQAVDCFISLGVGLIMCESFGAIYKRNAINSGFPIICCPKIFELTNPTTGIIKDNDILEINIETGEIYKVSNNQNIKIGEAIPFSNVQIDIYDAGNLFNFTPPIN